MVETSILNGNILSYCYCNLHFPDYWEFTVWRAATLLCYANLHKIPVNKMKSMYKDWSVCLSIHFHPRPVPGGISVPEKKLKIVPPLDVSLVIIYCNLGARNAQQNLTKIQLITTDILSFVTQAHPEFNHMHYCNQPVNHILRYFIFDIITVESLQPI